MKSTYTRTQRGIDALTTPVQSNRNLTSTEVRRLRAAGQSCSTDWLASPRGDGSAFLFRPEKGGGWDNADTVLYVVDAYKRPGSIETNASLGGNFFRLTSRGRFHYAGKVFDLRDKPEILADVDDAIERDALFELRDIYRYLAHLDYESEAPYRPAKA